MVGWQHLSDPCLLRVTSLWNPLHWVDRTLQRWLDVTSEIMLPHDNGFHLHWSLLLSHWLALMKEAAPQSGRGLRTAFNQKPVNTLDPQPTAHSGSKILPTTTWWVWKLILFPAEPWETPESWLTPWMRFSQSPWGGGIQLNSAQTPDAKNYRVMLVVLSY